MKFTLSSIYSPSGTFPKRLIPATLNVKSISVSKAAVFKIFPMDIKSVFRSVLSPSEVLTILKRRDTLIILRAVTLKFNCSSNYSSTAMSDRMTIMQSNLFQLTYQ